MRQDLLLQRFHRFGVVVFFVIVTDQVQEAMNRQMAEMMSEIYAANFRDPAVKLPEIISVTGEEFYGQGYDDSDRRIPDIAKARALLGWEPVWGVRELLETTMRYYVSDFQKNTAGSAV